MCAGNALAQAPAPPAPAPTVVVVQPGYGQQPPPGYGQQPPPGYGQPPPGYAQPGYGAPPPGAYYAPAPGYPGAPMGPKVLDYEEGDSIPAGYRTGTRVRKGLVIGGAVMLGVGYIISITAAGLGQLVNEVADGKRDFGPLLIPVVGPFVGIATTDPSTGGAFGLAFLGTLQTAGLAMLIGGIAAPKTVLIRNEVGNVKLTVLPQVGAGTAGLGVVGVF